jgi:TPR repeat protein
MSFKEEFERDLAAAEAGDPNAQRAVGNALLRGTVVPRDLEAGRSWLERAIDQNDFEALRQLAAHDLLAGKLGRGPFCAWALLQKGAQLGDAHCAAEVARGIQHGFSLENPDQSRAYFERTGLPADEDLARKLGEA